MNRKFSSGLLHLATTEGVFNNNVEWFLNKKVGTFHVEPNFPRQIFFIFFIFLFNLVQGLRKFDCYPKVSTRNSFMKSPSPFKNLFFFSFELSFWQLFFEGKMMCLKRENKILFKVPRFFENENFAAHTTKIADYLELNS